MASFRRTEQSELRHPVAPKGLDGAAADAGLGGAFAVGAGRRPAGRGLHPVRGL